MIGQQLQVFRQVHRPRVFAFHLNTPTQKAGPVQKSSPVQNGAGNALLIPQRYGIFGFRRNFILVR